MATTRTLRHERVDDIPLIIGVANRLQLAEVLDRHLGTHSLQEGLSNGWRIVGWLAYILSHADHRKSAVQAWANAMPQTLEHLLGQPIRTVECSDDRRGCVLRRRSDATAWEAIERDLWAATVAVYEPALTEIRLDSTTSYGSHQVTDTGIMQLGHSKDHRPDLPQLQGRAQKAESQQGYRFRNLSGMLDEECLTPCWRDIRQDAASGGSRCVPRHTSRPWQSTCTASWNVGRRNGTASHSSDDTLCPKGLARSGLGASSQEQTSACNGQWRASSQPSTRRTSGAGALGIGGMVAPWMRWLRKWRKAGGLDTDGQVLHPVTGTPQGGVVTLPTKLPTFW